MPNVFPAGIPVTTLTGRYLHLDGSPAVGSVTFRGPRSVTFTDADTIIVGPITVTLDSAGAFSVQLVATDTADMSPTGWTYSVTERVSGAEGRTYPIFLPHDPSPVDIADLAPASPTYGVYLPVVGPQGPAGPQGTPTTVNGKSGASITLTAADVGADAAGAAEAAQSAAASDATGKVAAHAAVTTSVHGIADTAALVLTGDPRLSPAVAVPSDNNLLWWSFPPINAGGANVPSAANVPGKLTLQRVLLRSPATISKIWLGISSNDAGATFTNCYLGLYDATGTLRAQTADISPTLHTSAANAYAFTGSATLSAGEYFIALLLGNGSTWTTFNLKSSLGGVSSNAGLAAPHLHLANMLSGLSALPASVDLSAMTTTLITGGWGSQWYGLS